MNDWAKDKAAKIRQQRENQSLRDAKFVEQQKLKKQFGPPLWTAVCEEVKAKCEALNNEMHGQILMYEFTRHGEISVIGTLEGKRKELRATFDPVTGTLSWDSAGRKDSLTVWVSDDGSGAAFYWGQIPSTPESIARQMLDPLLNT